MSNPRPLCPDCNLPFRHHYFSWLDELAGACLPHWQWPRAWERALDYTLAKSLTSLGLASWREDFTVADLEPRSWLVAELLRQRGIPVAALAGPLGFSEHFRITWQNRFLYYETLPLAEFTSRHGTSWTDDKVLSRQRLQAGGFPLAPGRAFWFWQVAAARRFAQQIGFPLVVKPRRGSVSRHVTTAIQTPTELMFAIRHALRYAPSFIVERFIDQALVHRITIVDQVAFFCVRQVPANVHGDGRHTIQQLISQKNADSRRGPATEKTYTLNHLVIDVTAKQLLAKQGYQLTSVPAVGTTIYLQTNSFLKLGGDLVDLTEQVHPANWALLIRVSQWFDLRLVGIDFIIPDITRPWSEQNCAILELNSLPCIDLHVNVTAGQAQPVAAAVANLLFKYY